MPNTGANLRDRATGFGAEQIDALMKDAWVDGFWSGANEHGEKARAECREATDQTYRSGVQKGQADAFQWFYVNAMRRVEEAEDLIANLKAEVHAPEDVRAKLDRIEGLVTGGATAFRKKRQELKIR